MTEYGYPVRTATRKDRCNKCLRYVSYKRRHSCSCPFSGDVIKIDVADPLYDQLMLRIRSEHYRLWVDMTAVSFVAIPKANAMAAIGKVFASTWFSILFSSSNSIIARPEHLYETNLSGVLYVNMDSSVIFLPEQTLEDIGDELPIQKWIILPDECNANAPV